MLSEEITNNFSSMHMIKWLLPNTESQVKYMFRKTSQKNFKRFKLDIKFITWINCKKWLITINRIQCSQSKFSSIEISIENKHSFNVIVSWCYINMK